MAEDVTFLFDFVQDIQNVVTVIFGVFEFLIGMSYVSGKYLTTGILDLVVILWSLAKDVVVGMEFSLQLVAEFSGLVLRAFLLIYYAIGQIIDAFYLTFDDLVVFIGYAAHTIFQLTQTLVAQIIRTSASLVVVPDQLCSALSIVGDFLLTFSHFLGTTVATTLYIVISTPLYAFNSLYVLFNHIISVPPKIFAKVPVSAYIGLVFIMFCYFIHCRLSLRNVVLTSFNLLRRTYTLFRALVAFLAKYAGKEPPKSHIASSTIKDKNDFDDNPKALCVICLQRPVTYLAVPCNHICICRECCSTLVKVNNRCPMCRKYVESYTRVYIS